jgi:hypothetical protein
LRVCDLPGSFIVIPGRRRLDQVNLNNVPNPQELAQPIAAQVEDRQLKFGYFEFLPPSMMD